MGNRSTACRARRRARLRRPALTADAALGYERRIPISQEVAPGKTDSFEIPLAAAASSRHRLTVRVLAGAEPAGAPRELELDILVPRPPAG